MEEISLFGIAISTFANLLVAVATFLMVYYTYVAVTTSQKQFLIFQREKEKPQVSDQIQNVFNVIQSDIRRELDAIYHSALSFPLTEGLNINDDNPLVFPIAAKKAFYANFRKSFHGGSVLSNNEVIYLINSIEDNLQKRYGIYQSLSEKMRSLEKDIDMHFIQPNYRNLFLKFPGLTVEQVSNESGSNWKILRDNREIEPYFVSMMKRSISNIILAKIIQSNDNPTNRVMSYISDLILEDLNNYIQTLTENIPNERFILMKQEIAHDLDTLKITDELIFDQIQDIKLIYRDMFLLTATELEPPKDNW